MMVREEYYRLLTAMRVVVATAVAAVGIMMSIIEKYNDNDVNGRKER